MPDWTDPSRFTGINVDPLLFFSAADGIAEPAER